MALCEFFFKELERDNSDMADAMRYLFDVNAPLHQNLFQSQESSQTLCDPSYIDRLSEEEVAWRKSLAVGSKIDAIKVDMEFNLKMWAKGEIISVIDGIYYVVFENDLRSFSSRHFHWYSPEIERYNTKSENDEWRLELKAGDLIDAFDSTKVWYQATVQDTLIKIDEGREVIHVKVGFRIYHPEGNKLDDDNRKYFGWSDRFDEWIPAYNPRIQKFQSFAKTVDEAQQNQSSIRYEETIDDQMDLLLYQSSSDSSIFAVSRRRCKSLLLVQFINRFGELGGFLKIVERLNIEKNDQFGLETVYYYLDCLSKSTCMYNKVFINEYLPQLEEAVKKKILTATEIQLRNIKKDRIDGIINCLIMQLQSRYKSYKQREYDKCYFNLEIGALFLTLNFLERRIDGAKIVQEVSRTASMSTFTPVQETVHNNLARQMDLAFVGKITQSLKENKILFEFFSKERGHLQLVQRSEELLKFLISQNAFSDEELEFVWNSTKIDETTKLELYRIFNELTSRFKIAEVSFIIHKISQIPMNKIVMEELKLIHELAKRSRGIESEYGKEAVEFIWNIAFSNNEDFISTFQKSSNQSECVDIENIMQSEQQTQEEQPLDKFYSKATFIDYIEKQFNFMHIFFSDFTHYMFKARSCYRKKIEAEPNVDKRGLHDKVLADKFIHSDQLNERLEFVKYLSQNSTIKINNEHLAILWDELVVHSLFPQDYDMFYRWLKDLCDSHSLGEPIIELEELFSFFREKLSNDLDALKTITLEGYNCVQSFFILINEASKNLIRLGQGLGSPSAGQQQVQKFTSYSNVTGQEYKSYSFNQNKQQNVSTDDEVEIQILVHPEELESINSLWYIATESQDPKVVEKTTPFLIKVYTSVTFRLEPQLQKFEEDFLKRCIGNINRLREMIISRIEQPKEEYEKVEKPLAAFAGLTNSVLQRVLPPQEKKILRYISLIKELIKNSEKDGTLGVKSHSALFKGEYLHSIQVTNSLQSASKFQQKIEFGVYSNTTLWDLRRIIGERVSRVYVSENLNGAFFQEDPCHPASIRLYRFSGCTDLKEFENGRTLAELRFKPNEQLTAFRRNVLQTTKVPLVNESGTDLSDRAIHIFTEWFNMYSIEDPEIPGKRYMTPPTAAQFTSSCTEEKCTEEDSRIIGLFAMYDGNHDGRIELEEFLNFYRYCVSEKEDVVRLNLMNHLYRYDLKKQPIDGYNEFMMQVRQSKEDMPRYKIADNPHYFDSIFALLDLQGEVATTAWNLLKIMTTNPSLYWKVLTLNKDPEFQWEQIFDSDNIYKMLYTLQIVESLLEEDRNLYLNTKDYNQLTQEEQLKSDWIERFLSTGGFTQILKLFHTSLQMISLKQMDLLTKFEKNFLEYMLKLIRIFILSAFSANDQSVYELINLVKKKSAFDSKQVGDNENEQKKDDQEENEEKIDVNEQDKFKTPAKQVKPDQIIAKKINNQNVDIRPEDLDEEAIFGPQNDAALDPTDFIPEKEANTQSAQQQNFDNDNERFSELAKIMKETGLGEAILNKIDFKILQNEVLEVISLILSKKEIIAEDVQITENALSLWMASLIKNDNLFDEFFKFSRSEEIAGKYGIRTAEDLILSGIYTYKSYRVREEFCNAIYCIAQKVKKVNYQVKLNELQNKEKLPLYYFLDVMQRNFPREDQYYATRECKQYFDLFISLVDEFIEESMADNNQQWIVDPYDMLRAAIEKLKRHETKEKKGSILEDKTLIGYFQLIEKLIVYLSPIDKERLQLVLDETNLIHELFYENLFYNPLYAQSKQENKSKCKESRAACYSLILKVLESLEPRELADFLEDNLWPLIKDIPRPKKWKYVPSENTKSTSFVGIVNLGCICYMISMLQQFFMVPQFRYQLLKAEDNSVEDLREYKGHKIDDNLLKQLQKMYGFLELSEKQAYDPIEFCFAMKDFEGNPTNTAIQQDAQEFLNIFFDRIEEQLKPTSQKHLLEGVFGGKVCSQLICQSCGNVRNILENFYNLSLPVKDRKGLEDSLQKMIEGSLINDYQCDACKQRVDVYKRSLIAETPNVLIVHLQRIIFNFDTFQNDKINTRFEFPNVLNLKEFSFKEVMQAEGRPKEQLEQDNVKHLLEMADDEFIYRLVGVIIHRGTAEHGHYYSLINTKRGSEEPDEGKAEWAQTEKDPWKEFNDETVKYFSFSDLKTEAFGGSQAANNYGDSEMNAYLVHSGAASSYGQNAYMLVYERMKKKDLKEIRFENQVQDSQSNDALQSKTYINSVTLECADTATSRVNLEEAKEVLIPYRKVESHVPEWIRKLVVQDNSTFMMDRYIYHESFLNLLKNIFKHIANKILLSQHHYKLEYIPHFVRLKNISMEIGHKAMFELLAYYYYNTQMSDLTNSLQSIVQFCDSHYTMSRNNDSILQEFLQKAFLEDDCTHFFNIIFDCGDKTSRYYIGRLTSFVINKIYSILEEAENKEAPKLIQLRKSADYLFKKFVLKLKSNDCMKNWSRFEQFLKLIHDIGCGGKYQVNFLLTEFDIVVYLIDFMLGNNSPTARQMGEKRPQMGSVGNNPLFEPLVSLVCFLARFSLTTQMVQERHSWDLVNNPPPSTLLGYNVVVDNLLPEKYPLSDKAVQFIAQSGFLEKFLREGIECEELGKLLAHYCYQNEQLSISLSKTLLHGISRNDYEKVKNYLDVVTQLALIRDNFQRKRLEWIFGIGSLICHTMTISKTDDINETRTKIGIKVLQTVNDEVYTYRSALIYDSLDDALLHLLWRYKGRMDSYTINCLFSLLNLIAQDDNVAQYFSELPGPTYFYARYTDWIKPYLQEQLVDARKGYAGSFSAQKEEIVVKALSLYEKYDEFLDRRLRENNIIPNKDIVDSKILLEQNKDIQDVRESDENVKNLINNQSANDSAVEQIRQQLYPVEDESKVIQCIPKPYIIIDCLSEKTCLYHDFEGVALTITTLNCLYTESKPTGNQNLSIPKNLFRRNFSNFNMNRASNRQTKEHQMQAQYIQNYFQSSGFSKQKQGKETKVQDQFQGKQIPPDDNKQWNIINNMNISDGEEDETGYSQDQEDENRPKRQNSGIDEGLETEPIGMEQITYKIKVIEEGQEDIPQTDNYNANTGHQNENIEYQDQVLNENNMNQEEAQQEQVEEEEVKWPYQVNQCEDLVYKIQVENRKDFPVKISLLLMIKIWKTPATCSSQKEE